MKLPFQKLIAAGIFGIGLSQSHAATVWTTNWVEANEDFRIVQGKLYNRTRSQNWLQFQMEVSEVGTNFLIGRKFKDVEHWSSDVLRNRVGSYYGSSRKYSNWIIVTNAETSGIITGQTASGLALPVGTRALRKDLVVEVLDRGTRREGSWMAFSNGVAKFPVVGLAPPEPAIKRP